MVRRVALTAVLSLAVGAPAPALAERTPLFETTVQSSNFAGYPDWFALAGDGVAYVDKPSPTGLELRFARPGDRTALVRRFDRPPPAAGFFDPHVVGSGSHLAATVSTGASGRTTTIAQDDVFAGPPAGPLNQLGDFCQLAGRRLIALDASRVAYTNACDVTAARIVVREVDTGQEVASVDVGHGRVSNIDLAGRYLAWEHGATTVGSIGEVVVHDLLEGREVMRLPGYGGAFAIQSDGKIARLVPPPVAPGRCGFVEWFDAAGGAHRIPGCVATETLAFAQDRIAFVALERGRHVAVLARLDGTLDRIASPANRVDWNGDRIAYASRECDGGTTVTLAAAGTEDEAEDPACPVRVSRRRALPVTRPSVRIACPRGCHGVVVLEASGGGRTLARREFALGEGDKRAIPLRMQRGHVIVLGRRHRTRAVLTVRTAARAGFGTRTRRVVSLLGRR